MKKFFRPTGVAAVCLLIASVVSITGCGKSEDTGAMATGPGAPQPVPGAITQPGIRPMATNPAQPGANTDPKAPISFEMVPGIIKPIKNVVEKDKETKMVFTYKRFKYKDWEGNICVCQMPEGETKVQRTKDAWLATFDFYKVFVEKKKVKRMSDFPFVSPPPSEGDGQQTTPTPPPAPGPGPVMPAPGGTRMPGH